LRTTLRNVALNGLAMFSSATVPQPLCLSHCAYRNGEGKNKNRRYGERAVHG